MYIYLREKERDGGEHSFAFILHVEYLVQLERHFTRNLYELKPQ